MPRTARLAIGVEPVPTGDEQAWEFAVLRIERAQARPGAPGSRDEILAGSRAS